VAKALARTRAAAEARRQEANMTQTADEFMLMYERATNSHDVEATLSLVDEQAVYLFSDGSVHVGKRAIKKVVRRNFDLIKDESYSIDNLTWLVNSRDVAACVYDYSWSGMIKGEPASGSGRGTTILGRTEEGWKVVHEHLSRGRFAA
jgi:ketosteroid isomerase-like protein